MQLRLSYLAVPALLLVAGCDESMMMGGGQTAGDAGTIGSGTNTQVGADNIQTTATTPQGILRAQLAEPSQVGECERLALVIEDSASTEVARQAAIEDRQRIGCPA
ncbi:hypothetical protein Rumeso_02583 [Rubellimicrobium mesophilum DSM 19309]|uniref:Lipoprotein n=1 Tax=Rubellimicrobium mesophilum DSM 19309 TaxID=442562 RepID=A0A017HN43_9RHOB|nr:hypothetical protein [Rubellimicrobium mesophilum]EYD75801.1 hypothetical protein Rumeso_02583 [Rubellimicrobium mesophilum DSM 19309]